jgi:uncharacterized membrane protein
MTYPPPGASPYEPQPPVGNPPPGAEIPVTPTGYPQYGTYAPPPAYPPPPGYLPQPGYLPPGYGPPPGYAYQRYAPPQFTAGDAWNWAWGQFRKRAGLLIGGPLAWLGVIAATLVPFIIGIVSMDPNSPAFIVVMVLMYLAIFGVGLLMSNCLMATQFDIADAKPITLGTFFHPRHFGPYVAVYLLTVLITAVGAVACILPGIILGFFAQYAPYFVIDRQLSPIAAIKASFTFVKNNLGTTILVYLIVIAAGVVAELGTLLTLGFGGLAILPAMLSLVGLIHVVTYRHLSGGQVAPILP